MPRLPIDLTALSEIDFVVRVTYGSVFAGTAGAEHRYGYTVIGDAEPDGRIREERNV